MVDIDPELISLLAGSPWSGGTLELVPSDASGRRYYRIHKPGSLSALLMDARNSLAVQNRSFIVLAEALKSAGFTAPEIYCANTEGAVLIVEDLGRTDYAAHLRERPDDEAEIYAAATDVLLKLRNIEITGLPVMNPLVAGEMVGLVGTWYIDDPNVAIQLTKAVGDAMNRLAPTADTLALRDVHSENLIWRQERSGLDRIGLIDFQDAVMAPAGYDLASLIRDARRDVSAIVADQMISRYAAGIGIAKEVFMSEFSCLSVQRNLRILGVFARLALQSGRTGYAALIPRVWQHLQTDLADPRLAELRDCVSSCLPAPRQSRVSGLIS